mgnify:CR=1 FL=1
MDAIAASRRCAVDVAVRGHFGYVAVFGEFHHAISAGRFKLHADAKIKRARVTVRAVSIAVTSEPAVFRKFKGELAGAQNKTGEGDEHESGPQGLRAYSMHDVILPEFGELAK